MSKWSSPDEIPHAKNAYGEGQTLHVVTDLMHLSDSPGFDRQRHDEMMYWVQWFAGYDPDGHRRQSYTSYVIHSPDQP